jgi:hypothetical protein
MPVSLRFLSPLPHRQRWTPVGELLSHPFRGSVGVITGSSVRIVAAAFLHAIRRALHVG